jgi:hypothetical protein
MRYGLSCNDGETNHRQKEDRPPKYKNKIKMSNNRRKKPAKCLLKLFISTSRVEPGSCRAQPPESQLKEKK